MTSRKGLKDVAYGRGTDDRNDVRWAHPELAKYWVAGEADLIDELCNEDIPVEERRSKLDRMVQGVLEANRARGYDPFEGKDFKEDGQDYGELHEYRAKGCPEAPDDDVTVWVLEPYERVEGRPVIFYCMSGAMFTHHPGIFFDTLRWAKRFGCVMVIPNYRTPLDGHYPDQINDIHAAYQWMLDNADTLGIDPDNVTLFGESTGAHYALCTCFRLKRYSITPRGCVVNDAMVDDRNFYESSKIVKAPCDAMRAHAMYTAYVGAENVGSNYLGPEAFANHATVDECKGLCPIFINIGESDQDRDAVMALASKLYAARVPCSIHVWEGASHATLYYARKTPMAKRFWNNLFEDIRCCMEYDMRRPWAWDACGDND